MRTGLAIALPDGYAAFVHPRSGLAAKHGVTLVNAPGTVDAGYRGEIKVTLLNTDRDRRSASGAGTGSRSWSSSGSNGGIPRGDGASRVGPRGRRLRLHRAGTRSSPRGSSRCRYRPELERKERVQCFVGVVQQTRAAMSSIMTSRSSPRGPRVPEGGPWDSGEPFPGRSGWTSAACRCRSGRSTRSSSSWPSSTAPGSRSGPGERGADPGVRRRAAERAVG